MYSSNIDILNRLNDTRWTNADRCNGGQWTKERNGMMPAHYTQACGLQGSIRASSSPSTTIMNNNSQDLYAEVSDVTVTSGLLSTFNNPHAFQHQSSGDPEPYATTTLAMHNTNARLMVHIHIILSLCQGYTI
jgi:hypothetical protein